MSDTNQITVRGRVGTDPDVLVTQNGKQITKFRLGSTRSYRDAAGEWREVGTEWFTVKVWGPSGQAVQDSLHRGMPVIVQGALSSEEWVSGERTHHTNIITATAIGVDIKYGLVTFAKITRQAPAENGQSRPDEDAAPSAEDAGEQPEGTSADDDGDGAAPPPASGASALDPWEKVDA